MSRNKPDEKRLREVIASNLAYYRKLCGMTQSELAEKLNYSDKSVSKWERADGAPDVYVLKTVSELFGVTLNDLVSENEHREPVEARSRSKQRIMTLLLSVVLLWLIATVIYTSFDFILPGLIHPQYIFLMAIPISCVPAVVMTSLWWGWTSRAVAVSALVWSIAICVYVLLPLPNGFLIFTIAGLTQLLALLWFIMKGQHKIKTER